jgi:Sec-independent protein translocase protein TatA
MNFLGIGTLELAMIILIALMLIGPMDMVRFARKAGEFLRQVKQSEIWQSVQGSRRTMNRMGRELIGGAEGDLESIRRDLSKVDFTAGVDQDLLNDISGLKQSLVGGALGMENNPAGQSSTGAGKPADLATAPKETQK